jgi:hypothetical protein
MPTAEEYQKRIRKLRWPEIKTLWNEIISPGAQIGGGWWQKATAFEYLVVRMFELDKADVTWPYVVYLDGPPAKEQIDGSVRFGGLHCLIESKSEDDDIAVDPIAKLRNQLLRRPWGTIGLVFTTTKFTAPSVLMTQFALPQPILLWTGAEIDHAIKKKKICEFAQTKYRVCVEHGLVDWNITVP